MTGPHHAAVAAEALREAARMLAQDVREDATHARAIEFLHRRAEAYDRAATGAAERETPSESGRA